MRDEGIDVKDFKDEVSHCLNYGKYQLKVIYGGTPTWTGKSGEYVLCYILDAGTNTYHFYDYYYIGEPVNQWLYKVAVGVTG
jgi:mRNA-degrading endonuclease RelE of RelBE toxin-antitoxin system